MGRCGLVSVSFRDKSVAEIVDAVKENGLHFIEWGSDIHAPNDNIKNLQMIQKTCENNGIEISSYGTYFKIGENPACDIIKYIDAAKILGTDILRIWCGTKGFSEYSQSELEGIINECKEVAKTAKDKNAILCLECHPDTVTDCPEGALCVMNAVGSEYFRMYWQPNQYHSVEWNLNYAEKISKYTKIIHTFYWDEKNSFPLANGLDIWKKYLKKFKNDVPCLLEFMPDGRFESLQAEAKTVKMLCGEEK